MKSFFFAVLTLAVIAPTSSLATNYYGEKIYAFRDSNGVMNFSNAPFDKRAQLIYSVPASGKFKPRAYTKNTPKLINLSAINPVIERLSTIYNVDKKLIHSIIKVESGYDANAISHAGAMGMMQLMPETARRYGVRNAYNPEENIAGGVRYMCDLLIMFNNNVSLALAGYNAGENAVIKHGRRIPPYEETQKYVPKVLALYKN